jgi:hypothetical protein
MLDADTLKPTEDRVIGSSMSSPLGNRTRSTIVLAANETAIFAGATQGLFFIEGRYDNIVIGELMSRRHTHWTPGNELTEQTGVNVRNRTVYRAVRYIQNSGNQLSNVAAVDELGRQAGASQFLDSWTRGGYVYIVVADIYRVFGGTMVPWLQSGGIIRICESEMETGGPHPFRTALRGELYMNRSDTRNVYGIAEPHRLLAARHTEPLPGVDAEPPVYYITQDEMEWVISDTVYSGRGGIDFELDGYINRAFWDAAEEPIAFNFSCDRSILYGTLNQHVQTPRDTTRDGWFHRRELMRTNADVGIADLIVHSMVYPPYGVIDELYIRFNTSRVRRVTVVRDTGLTYYSGDLQSARDTDEWGLMGLSKDGSTLLLGGEKDVIAIPVAECGEANTCNSCLSMSEVRCGWCVSTARCTRSPECTGSWQQHLFNSSAPDMCDAPVQQVSVAVSSITSTSFFATIDPPTTASGTTPADLEYTLYIDNQMVGSSSSTAILPATGLTPYTTYNVEVEVRSRGGRVRSPGQIVETLQGPASVVTGLAALAETGPNVRLTWGAPASPNGVVLGYTVLRNGTQVCCADGPTLSYLDTALAAYTVYSYSVQARTGTIATPIDGVVSSVGVRTVPTAPSRPLNGAISNLDQSSVSFITSSLFPALINMPFHVPYFDI